MRGEAVVVAMLLLPGCIQRYAAPTAPTPLEEPYASVAIWRGLELSERREAAALPEVALRLALGPGSEVYADDVLASPLDDHRSAEGWDAVEALVSPGSEPIVVLLHKGTDAPCDRLRPYAARITIAVRTGDELGGVSMTQWCPG